MENNKEVSTTEIVEEVKTDAVVKEEPKKEKLYTRAEVENIKKAEREIILKEQEIKKTEAEKLAKMDAEEKAKYEKEIISKERDEAISKLNSYQLKEVAQEIASEKGVPLALLKVIDYTKEDAESIKTKIEEIEVAFKQALQSQLNDKMKEKTPKTVVEETTQSNKPRASF